MVRGDGPRWPGVVSTRRVLDAPIDPAFARQQLPAARLLHGESVRDLAEAVYAAVDGFVDGPTDAFTLHVFVPDAVAYKTVAGRAGLLEATILDLWRQRRRRSLRHFVPGPEARARWGQVLVIQVAVVGRTSLLVSAVRPRALPGGGVDLAPWPAGLAPVAEDRTAPSRAYRKLQEGFAWLGAGLVVGQTCVDLGGAPGGWAWTALSAGAKVIAVDRSPLAPPALGHPRLRMIVGDAFAYQPAHPVDWLLCDVICAPPRTVELVEHWMAHGWCRFVVATIKFKGQDGYGVVAVAQARLAKRGWRHVRIKHMFHHNNEVAILAARD